MVAGERQQPRGCVFGSVAMTMKITSARQMLSLTVECGVSSWFRPYWLQSYQLKSLYSKRLACFCRSKESTGQFPVSYQLVRSEVKTAAVEIIFNSPQSISRL